ncbi:MAG: hypothetical protein NC898_01500 [Candidatus Omnitrophica bacterium]|nr:hypothetical protein [Candidatus Omnitrophota bacterium]MCM8793131.1 hypothetical protein [Candidatus Omnitrophota bacterium]
MKGDFSILILGEGRIACAVFTQLKDLEGIKKIEFFSSLLSKNKVRDFSLIISSLPGKDAPLGLELAIKYKKHLLDISDLDPPFYLRRKGEIEKAEILVVPGCGFSPGLVNFIVGREIHLNPEIDSVEIKAGSLSPKKFFFPFLWCFEDLIQEHRLFSWQIIQGKRVNCPPFSGYQKEKFLSIPAESYFSVSGFENIFEKKRFLNFHFRVIRPEGFMNFFYFLENFSFLDRQNLNYTRNILEGVKRDNYTLAFIELRKGRKKIVFWEMYSFSRRKELFNSMQKISSAFSVAICKTLFLKGFSQKGIIFAEELAKDGVGFKEVIKELKKRGIVLRRICLC